MFSKTNGTNDKKGQATKKSVQVAPSIVSADMTVAGDLQSDGEVQVDGTVNGDVRTRSLLVGETATVRGEIVADTVRVHGTVDGQIKARSVTLARSARVSGDIVHETLAIEQGAFLEGHCRRIDGGSESANEGRINLVKSEGSQPSRPAAVASEALSTGQAVNQSA